jgi:hypothetical protein
MHIMSRSDEQVKLAYGAWEQSRDRLKALEKLLEQAMTLHAQGASAPTDLVAEIQVLRTRTDELLSVALQAMTARAGEKLQPGLRDSGP